jgi:hypothetical protein
VKFRKADRNRFVELARDANGWQAIALKSIYYVRITIYKMCAKKIIPKMIVHMFGETRIEG